jgi:hypothetical protein
MCRNYKMPSESKGLLCMVAMGVTLSCARLRLSLSSSLSPRYIHFTLFLWCVVFCRCKMKCLIESPASFAIRIVMGFLDAKNLTTAFSISVAFMDQV